MISCTGDGIQGIRIVDGFSNSSGRVKVFVNDVWGTVCDDLWELLDATVVCKQLGYQTALAGPTEGYFGLGTGPIWMDNVQCRGTEVSLSECNQPPLGEHDCRHFEDAGVACVGKNMHALFKETKRNYTRI
ncbi:Neurotrypsin [Holothuria leucospilota]|uniref:Neurotrypsin n=1 Tax=Holothuria leucospilota TaxID=206669 RepID=A0A9Q1BAY4_HOLLE|nr:Neurotrypsin [Holothuria leucospilota]